MNTESTLVTIEVVYAEADDQQLVSLTLDAGTTAREALHHALNQSLIIVTDNNDTAVDPLELPIGVYGHSVSDDYAMKDGDRLELYRPLLQDPMERRRKVARQSR